MSAPRARHALNQRAMMKPIAILVLALAGCQSNQASEQYGFLARLGNDTVSVERVTRRGDEIVSDEVDRFPRVRRRHTTIRLAANGTIKHLEMDIVTPSEPSNERERHVVADVSADSVHLTKHDSTGTKKYAFATGGAPTRAVVNHHCRALRRGYPRGSRTSRQ